MHINSTISSKRKTMKLFLYDNFSGDCSNYKRFLSRQLTFLPGIGCIYAFKSLEKKVMEKLHHFLLLWFSES